MKVNFESKIAAIKPMNAVNNGPVYTKNTDQNSGNLIPYREANIPFARTHDAAFFSRYGGEHTVDVHLIFRDFDADPYDPASYDFHLTDEYMETIQLAGTQVFYRLGAKIEHESKHYGILPPKDPKKWAVICEHIIAHMNEGWADGHHYGIKYWEIWNEPDLYGKCWLGTPEQFYELFAVTAKHLKARFPELKIGGPAVCGFNEGWLRPFFAKLRDENVPMDFYSWHCYSREIGWVSHNARRHRALADEYGFTETESILNEWNYVKGWSGDAWTYSIEQEIGIKGAAFIAAVMSDCQNAPVDMLMYYDARGNSKMNGMFDFYTKKLLKGYFSIKTWGEMLKMGTQCEVTNLPKDIYATAAIGEDGSKLTMISYFSDNDDNLDIEFPVELVGVEETTMYLLDDAHDMTPVKRIFTDNGKFTLTMKVNTVVVLK